MTRLSLLPFLAALWRIPRISGLSAPGTAQPKTTIAVCTGLDCRVDGASDSIRRLQRAVSADEAVRSSVRVTGRACVGPCGDGPCAMITDANGEKVVVAQPSKVRISLAEPGLFASDPRGWYQVRTEGQVDEVMDVACAAAGVEYEKEEGGADADTLVATPSRRWFDRPRNERKVLQRLMQALVAAGLYGFDGELGNTQYGIALFLFFLSDFIMRENIWTFLLGKLAK